MKVLKRNGTEVEFNQKKIEAAVTKANNAAVRKELTEEQIRDIADFIGFKCAKINRTVTVEEIQDMVENQIMAAGAFDVARGYVRYRYQRSLVRKSNTTDQKILTLIDCNNEEAKQENANKNPTVNSVQRDYIAEKFQETLPKGYFFRKMWWRLTEKGLFISMMRITICSICITVTW